MRNIEVERTGAILPGEIVLLGVPYDSVAGSPGANDNASGVAALLELARRPEDRPVRLVAFLNEESPFLNSREMGSRVYVRRAAPGENQASPSGKKTLGTPI